MQKCALLSTVEGGEFCTCAEERKDARWTWDVKEKVEVDLIGEEAGQSREEGIFGLWPALLRLP